MAGVVCQAEISSVNRKQLDIVVLLPNQLAALEREARRVVADEVSRGRITVKVVLDTEGGDLEVNKLKVDENLARAYQKALGELCEDSDGRRPNLSPGELVRAPGVFQIEPQPLEGEQVWPVVEEAIKAALVEFLKMRQDEGQHVRQVLVKGLTKSEALVAAVRGKAGSVVEHYRKSLHRRLAEAGLDLNLDDERVLKEIGLFADRCDVSEELDRLDSHHQQFRAYLDQDEPVGRPLDFLAQEMNREYNTIGSKANDAGIAQLVVEGKTEVEKIREQVQNVE